MRCEARAEVIAWSEPPLYYERTPKAASAPLVAGAYQRHEPEQTALYQLVQEHLESALVDACRRTEHGFGYPRFVEQTLRDYLACGRHELGFARVRCRECGHEQLLAFSCKRRGLCPSCEARRMADTAAHLVDRVLPIVPYRQWVLSLPIPVRLHLVRHPALVSKVLRLFIRRIFAWQRRVARGMGIADGRCAAVTFIQRGGGALNLNPHFHTVAPDGVFDLRPDGSVQFVPVLAPTDKEVHRICAQVARRVHRLLSNDEGPADNGDDDALAPTLPLALPPGRKSSPRVDWEHPAQRPHKAGLRCATIDGYSLHAQTAVHAFDRAGLERLCRYGLRSSFTLSRLSKQADGRLSYRLKRPWPDGRTRLTLEPTELLRRLVQLIPPARSHLVRYHGAFAPASPIRSAIRPRKLRESCCPTRGAPRASAKNEASIRPSAAPAVAAPKESESDMGRADTDLLTLLGDPPDESELLPIRQRRLDWASLLRLVFAHDVLCCPKCAGRMVVLAAINDPTVAQKILAHLGLPTRGPQCAPARAPPDPEFDFDIDPDEHYDDTDYDDTDEVELID